MNMAWVRFFHLKFYLKRNVIVGTFILKHKTGNQLLEYSCCYLSLAVGKVVLAEKHRPENRPTEDLSKFHSLTSVGGSKLWNLCAGKALHPYELQSKCWICLSARGKVGKVRSENGEASWVRVGWGGWLWQTWESCPAASKLASTLILILGISEYVYVIFREIIVVIISF